MPTEFAEQQYQEVKANLLTQERNLMKLLLATNGLEFVGKMREAVVRSIENDDGTPDMTLRFSTNQIDMFTWKRINEQDKACAALRDVWRELLLPRKTRGIF